MRLRCEPVKLDLFYYYAKFANLRISCRSFKTFGATKFRENIKQQNFARLKD